MSKRLDKSVTSQSESSGKKKVNAKGTKSSGKQSKKRTSSAKALKTTSTPDMYSLNTWKWNYEDISKPKNKVVVSLTKRVKYAWKVLRG